MMPTSLLDAKPKPFVHDGLRKWFVPAVAVLFIVFASELYLSARQESQTLDEPAHLYAGYSQWLHSDFGINPEHPPLVKFVAALPLLVSKPDYPDPHRFSFLYYGHQSMLEGMIMMNTPNAQSILAQARTAVTIFAIVLGILISLMAREMFGDGAALIALLLFVFDPLILAHARSLRLIWAQHARSSPLFTHFTAVANSLRICV